MTKRSLISSILSIVIAASAVYAQKTRTAESSKTATPQAISLIPGLSLYSWHIRPDDNDGYFSSNSPQPVCGRVNGQFQIYIFTNFDYYPSKNISNQSKSVRVGQITPSADTYQLLSNNPAATDPHSLPGARQNFAATSLTGAGDTTFWIFGGTNCAIEMNDVYSYTEAGGFHYETMIPNLGFTVGNRSGAAAVPALGKIYLFGGRQGSAVMNQVLEFDPQTKQFTAVQSMPQAFYGARGMTKAVGSNNYIYLVGGITQLGGAPGNKIYRFDATTKQTIEVKNLNNPTSALTIPPGSGYPMATWDPSGKVRIIASGGNGAFGAYTWGNIQAWILNDTYGGANDGRATLTPDTYNTATRARDMAGAVKCGDATYLIGGTYGHGGSYQNRGTLVDKLHVPLLHF